MTEDASLLASQSATLQPSPPPRYEFRVFGERLEATRDILANLGTPLSVEKRIDIYVVAPDRLKASLKLREGALDLKLLRGRFGPLELWEPADRATLPLQAEAVRRRFFDRADLELELPDTLVTAEILLDQLSTTLGFKAIQVSKSRQQFRLGDAFGEFTEIRADRRPAQTVAVEGEAALDVVATIERLGLAGRCNRSYQHYLHMLAFWPAGGPDTIDPMQNRRHPL
jgi:hypothetical protein